MKQEKKQIEEIKKLKETLEEKISELKDLVDEAYSAIRKMI